MENAMHGSNPNKGADTIDRGHNSVALRLESIYRRYGQGIYTFCLRLLANERAAESATVDVFIELSKEMASQTDESRTLLRLRELAINASLARLNPRGGMIARRLSRSLRLKLRRLWR